MGAAGAQASEYQAVIKGVNETYTSKGSIDLLAELEKYFPCSECIWIDLKNGFLLTKMTFCYHMFVLNKIFHFILCIGLRNKNLR